jgi:hypothetical protein
LRAVIEDMAEMRPAGLAGDFGSQHAVAAVGFAADGGIGNRLVKAGPAGSGIKLRF